VLAWLARRLSRPTSSGNFIPEVDGLRFLAILGVLIVHSATGLLAPDGALGWASHRGIVIGLMGGGWFGVQIFFVLSGFIVTLPFARHWLQGTIAPDLKRYLVRRITRIEPPYMIALTAYYLWSGKAGQYLVHYVAGLFYSHQYVFGTMNPVAPPTWSLEVEVVFYLLAPWLTVVYRVPSQYRRWLLQLALIAGPAVASGYWLGPAEPARIQNTLVVEIQYFFAGMLLADLYACGVLRRSARFSWDLGAAGAAGGLTYIVCSLPSSWHYYWLTPMLIMLLFAGVIGGRFTNWFFRLRPVTIVGGMCYSLYLSHMAALMWAAPRLKPFVAGLPDAWAAIVYCSIVVPTMVAFGIPVYLLIERPFMGGRTAQPRTPVLVPEPRG